VRQLEIKVSNYDNVLLFLLKFSNQITFSIPLNHSVLCRYFGNNLNSICGRVWI